MFDLDVLILISNSSCDEIRLLPIVLLDVQVLS